MRCLFVAVVLAVTSSVFAQEARTHDVVPDDYFTLNAITEIAVSPDGKHVAYCLGTWDKAEDSRKTDLWVVPTDGKGKPTRLTFDRANDRHPKWSGDGKAIYFLGNRKRAAETKAPFDGTTQVWRIDAIGGDPKAVTREVGGISGYDYAPKADAIFFSKDSDHADDDAFAKLRAKYDKVEYGHGKRKISEIHKLDVNSWRSEKVVAEKRYVREFVVTQDGKKIAMISAFDDTVVKSEGESRVDVWEAGKVVTPPTDAYRKNPKNSPHAWLENLCWNPSGTKFAFTAVHDAFPAEVIQGSEAGSQWTVEKVNRETNKGTWEVVGYGRGIGQPLKWEVDDRLIGLVERRGKTELTWLTTPADNAFEDRSGNITGFDTYGDKLLHVSLLSYPNRFPHLIASTRNSWQILDPNPHTATWKLPTVQHVTWKAPDGAEVGGVLELPPGYKKGDKLPLVVAIHGGPTTSTKADLNFDPHNGRLYFAAAGYAVLLPNYRGSTGYGDKFVTDLIGNENDIEVKDILAGVQHLVKEGIADPDRVGCMGWSNGGYLTNCLITLKDSPVKFKAASSGAGILDTVAEWGFNDEPAYPVVFKKGTPWEQPEIYKKTSPTYGIGNVTTPTLIHVGGNDVRCPPGHSWMLYRALKEYKNVPTELVVYTGEPHGLTKMSNRKAKMEWDLAWFDKYLKNGK
jgi:dipeptidyl aminopeptidase/acylaminoacyl peptidase